MKRPRRPPVYAGGPPGAWGKITMLSETERRLKRTPLYNEIDLPRRFAWHSAKHDTFTVDGYTMPRARFIARWGQPGEKMDVITWDPYDYKP